MFVSYFPLPSGRLAGYDELTGPAQRLGATPAQVALAWLLRRSPAIVIIPGTANPAPLPLHHQESEDPQERRRRARRHPAAPAAPARGTPIAAAERPARRLTFEPARPGTAAPGPRHAPVLHSPPGPAGHGHCAPPTPRITR